jgi:DNA-binding transcriptional LysR family regulator
METQLLEAFVAVADADSFSVAAEKAHLTQPAISKRIAKLEEQLNCRLFDRIGRNINLTEAGRVLLPRAQGLLKQLDDTKQHVRDLSGTVSGNLRLAISHHIGLYRLPPVLKAFAGRYPEVSLELDFMDSEVAYDGVRQGDFELAVITLAPQNHSRIFTTAIWDDPLLPVCSLEHPLTSIEPLHINELSAYPAILPGLNTYTGRMIKQLFELSGNSLNATMATNYLETIKMMVSVGLGWSMLPATMIDQSLVPLNCEKLSLKRQLGCIHHQDKIRSNAASAFIELLLAHGDKA